MSGDLGTDTDIPDGWPIPRWEIDRMTEETITVPTPNSEDGSPSVEIPVADLTCTKGCGTVFVSPNAKSFHERSFRTCEAALAAAAKMRRP